MKPDWLGILIILIDFYLIFPIDYEYPGQLYRVVQFLETYISKSFEMLIKEVVKLW